MPRLCRPAALLLAVLFSCTRTEKEPAAPVQPEPQPVAPIAVVQAGEYPLWFQFTDEGQTVIETIEDARFSAALIPWPLAPHVRFTLAQGDDLMMAVNRGGFIRFSPWDGGGVGLYRYPGGEFWRTYTVGAFALIDDSPLALLYRDDRFLDSNAPLPSPRLWTFDPYSPLPLSRALPALDTFAPEDGWDLDALRRGADGLWYYRAVRKNTAQPQIRMLRSGDLAAEGEQVFLGAFQSTALPQPLSAAPQPLGELFAALFARGDCGVAVVVSPGFHGERAYALNREGAAVFGFYSPGGEMSPAFLLAAFPHGAAVLAEQVAGSGPALRRFALPPLPEGFVYTGIGMVADTVIAPWEEQDGYSIGAAGFMVIQGVGNRD